MIRGLLLSAALAAPAAAATLQMPADAARAVERHEALGSYAVPTAPWTSAGLPTLSAEGALLREAWHVPGRQSTLELLAPLRDQLAAQGYATILDCAAEACGGFDFRYEAEVLPEPEMHVDLGDFRFLAARRDAETGAEFLTLMVSRSATTGFVQVVRVAPPGIPTAEPQVDLATKSPGAEALPDTGDARAALPLDAALDGGGRVVLDGLVFEIGSAELADGPFPALEALADYLRAHPERSVTLVGHTDAAGNLELNVSLSRARARSVAEHLVRELGVPAAQVSSEGVGYLMPLASNLTDEGRAQNRRVEAVLTVTR